MTNEEYKPKHKIGDSIFFDGKYHKIIDIFKYISIDYVLEYGIHIDAKRADEIEIKQLEKEMMIKQNEKQDEEKAKEIIGCCPGCTFSCGDRLNCKMEDKYNIALEMAKYKNDQIDAILKKIYGNQKNKNYYYDSIEILDDEI